MGDVKVYDQDMWCSRCHKMNPCRWAPSPDAGPHWRCSECGEIVNHAPPEIVVHMEKGKSA
jgi:hypothetical protein